MSVNGVWAVFSPFKYEDDPWMVFASKEEAVEAVGDRPMAAIKFWEFGKRWSVDEWSVSA